MNSTNTITLNRARLLVAQDFGQLSDLPIELQNTIANIYYKFAQMMINVERDEQMSSVIKSSNNFRKGFKNYIRDSTFLIESKKSLPSIISDLRNEVLEKNDKKEISFTIFVLLSIFKYRIDNVMKKSAMRVQLERWFKSFSVDEISNLNKKFR